MKAVSELPDPTAGTINDYERQLLQTKEREKNSWYLLRGWALQLCPNTLTLFAASSGHGKTLLVCQFIRNALAQGKSVAFFGNEEKEADIYGRLKELYREDLKELHEAMGEGRLSLSCQDFCKEYVNLPRMIERYLHFDVVVVDQLNYLADSGDGSTPVELFRAIPKFLDSLKTHINGEKDCPAFICTQQMSAPEPNKKGVMEPNRWNLEALLKDSKRGIFNYTHTLMYAWDSFNGVGHINLGKSGRGSLDTVVGRYE